jgi:cytochrome c oxidase subunit 3
MTADTAHGQGAGGGHETGGGHGDPGDDLHLPHGSWWPVLVAGGITLLGLGVVLGGPFMVVGLVALLGALFGWVREDTKWWDQKIGTGEPAGRLGILLFMSSEVLLFGALFATYFALRGQSGHWPDWEEHLQLPLLKTGIFSLFLFASSATVHRAEQHLKADDRRGFIRWWAATIVLGAVFLGGQAWEYINLLGEGVMLGTSHFASTFYMITGTHGLHVLGGLVVLTIVLVRAMKGQFNSERHLAPTAAAMYWHFVDAIWVIVFTMLYLVQ